MVPGNPSALVKIATPRRYKDPARMAQIAGEIYGGKVRKQPELARKFTETAHVGSRLGYLYQLLGPVGLDERSLAPQNPAAYTDSAW